MSSAHVVITVAGVVGAALVVLIARVTLWLLLRLALLVAVVVVVLNTVGGPALP